MSRFQSPKQTNPKFARTPHYKYDSSVKAVQAAMQTQLAPTKGTGKLVTDNITTDHFESTALPQLINKFGANKNSYDFVRIDYADDEHRPYRGNIEDPEDLNVENPKPLRIEDLEAHVATKIDQETATLEIERDAKLAHLTAADENAHLRAPPIGRVRGQAVGGNVRNREAAIARNLRDAINEYRNNHPDDNVDDTGVVRSQFALDAEAAYFNAERNKLHAEHTLAIAELTRVGSRFQNKVRENAVAHNNTVAFQIKTWQNGLAGAKEVFSEYCSERVLEKLREDINANRVRRAF